MTDPLPPVRPEAIGLTGIAYEQAMAASNGSHARVIDLASTAPRTRWSAVDLLAAEFPEPRWAVPGILAEGVNLLAGSPKVGKSWFALGQGIAVASGGRALGTVPVDAGPVLYLALEDGPRRLRSRLELMLAGEPPPADLHLWTASDRLPEGAEPIRDWLSVHDDARLVVVDVLARIKPPSDPKAGMYESDYLATYELARLASEHSVCVLVVHHTRKSAADDWLDTVSGTQGLAGSADAVLVLRRQRGAATAELLITGRDVEEAKHPLEFAPDLGTWTLLDGPAEDYELRDTRRRVLSHIRTAGASHPKDIAKHLGIKANTVRQTLGRMVDDEQLDTDGSGTYFLPPSPVTPVTPVTGGSDRSDRGDRDTGGQP